MRIGKKGLEELLMKYKDIIDALTNEKEFDYVNVKPVLYTFEQLFDSIKYKNQDKIYEFVTGKDLIETLTRAYIGKGQVEITDIKYSTSKDTIEGFERILEGTNKSHTRDEWLENYIKDIQKRIDALKKDKTINLQVKYILNENKYFLNMKNGVNNDYIISTAGFPNVSFSFMAQIYSWLLARNFNVNTHDNNYYSYNDAKNAGFKVYDF